MYALVCRIATQEFPQCSWSPDQSQLAVASGRTVQLFAVDRRGTPPIEVAHFVNEHSLRVCRWLSPTMLLTFDSGCVLATHNTTLFEGTPLTVRDEYDLAVYRNAT